MMKWQIANKQNKSSKEERILESKGASQLGLEILIPSHILIVGVADNRALVRTTAFLLSVSFSYHTESEAGYLSSRILIPIFQRGKLCEVGEVETDLLGLRTLKFYFAVQDHGPPTLEISLQLGIVGLSVSLEPHHVFKCTHEGHSHLRKQAISRCSLQLLYLGLPVVEIRCDTRPRQLAVVEIGKGVEEGLQIIFFAQLQLTMGTQTRKTQISSERMQMLRVFAYRDQFSPSEADQFYLSAFIPHKGGWLQVLVQHSFSMDCFYHTQHLQSQISDFPKLIISVLQPFSKQLHFHKAAAGPLAHLIHFGH